MQALLGPAMVGLHFPFLQVTFDSLSEKDEKVLTTVRTASAD